MPQLQQLTSAPQFRIPASDPKAELLIVHGLAEHAERYRGIAERFAERGISTTAFDQRGHGKMPGVRTHVDRFDSFVADAAALVRSISANELSRPVFIWGHSMGSIVALLLALRMPQLAGLIVSSNSLEVFRRGTNPLNPLFRCAAVVLPKIRVPLGLDARKISRDESVRQAYANDPLIPPTASLRLIVEFAKACEQARAVAAQIRVPILVVHGRNDRIAPVRGSEILHELVSSGDKTLKVFPDALHEVHNEIEPERGEFIDLLAHWIRARCKP
jgi:acylglycerol lipase